MQKKWINLGSFDKDGYIKLTVKGRSFLAHRLAWLVYYGSMPNGDIDHIDHDKTNNKKSNLRVVNQKENARNKKLSVVSTTGVSGVNWLKRDKRWRVTIFGGKDRIQIGEYYDFFEAVCVRKSAERAYGYHENHGKKLKLRGE